MRKRIIYLLLLILTIILLPNTAFAVQISSTIKSVNLKENKLDDQVSFAKKIRTEDGGRIEFGDFFSSFTINGETIEPKGSRDLLIIKYNKNNKIEWWNQYGGSGYEYNGADEPIIDTGDGYIVSFSSDSTDIEGLDNKGKSDIVILKYDKKGHLLWQKNYGGNNYDSIRNLKSSNDFFVILAETDSSNIDGIHPKGNTDFLILKYDFDGNLIAQQNFGGASTDFVHEAHITQNHEILVTGSTDSNTIEGQTIKGGRDAILICYDENLNRLWFSIFGGNASDSFNYIREVTNGFLIYGNTYSKDLENVTTTSTSGVPIFVKYSNDGQLLWYSAIDETAISGYRTYSSGFKSIQSKAINDNEEIFIIEDFYYTETISGTSPQGERDVVVVKLDKDGKELWRKIYGGPGTDYVNYYKFTSDGGVLIEVSTNYNPNGNIYNENFHNRVLLKLDSLGNIEAEDIFCDGRENSILDDIEFEFDDGNVVLSTIYNEQNKIDTLITKYNENGNKIWQKNYGGNGIDILQNCYKDKNGNYVFIGISSSSNITGLKNNGNQDILLVSFDKKGNLIYQNNYGGSNQELIYNSNISPYGGGAIEVVTYSTDIKNLETKPNNLLIIRFDENGKFVFHEKYNVEVDDENEIMDIPVYIFTKDGGFIISNTAFKIDFDASTISEMYKSADIFIKKYSKTGNLEWKFDYAESSLDMIEQIEALPNGDYKFLGATFIPNDADGEMQGLQIDLSITYELEQEPTTDGTYEVKQENNKGIIILSPNKGYALDKIIITNSKGEAVNYYIENGVYYFDLTDDVKVNVTYKEKFLNPNTGTFVNILAMIIFAISSVIIYKYVKKHEPITRI